jgi:hypothetical protein
MNRLLFIFFLWTVLAFRFDKTKSIRIDSNLKKLGTSEKLANVLSYSSDTTVIPFDDTSYKLTLHVFNVNEDDPQINNTTLTFRRRKKNGLEILFSDSLYCMFSEIEFQDFNNDKIKDVLVFYYTGGRANPTYHLYLTDLQNRKLIRVKEFEELPNPILDTLNNIITSVALAGMNYYYSFYRINDKNKLVSLGHGFEADLNDSAQYENAIQAILKKQ